MSNIKNILQIGFITLLLLVFAFAVIGMYQIRLITQSLTRVVEINNTKVELAHNMRDAIRLRQISLNTMFALADPFKRNEELIRFYEYAGLYRHARSTLLSLPMNEQEQQIHKQLTSVARISQPLNKLAAELIADNASDNLIHKAVKHAQTEQSHLINLLNNLVALQKYYAQQAVLQGREQYDQALLIVISLGIPLMLGALVIVVLVSRYIAAYNQQLTEASLRAQSATKAKSAFLATMSHEIRTPMTSIIGFSEVALDHNQSETHRTKAINTILHSGKHLLQLINSILDLSKIEAGRLQIENLDFSPFELLREINTFITPQTTEKNLAFNLDFHFPLPISINSDPLRVKQILLNLCSNAIKFTNSGSVTVKMLFNQTNNCLTFNVIDTGIGMSTEQISQIFEAFTQADSTTTRKYGGTGLGLTLSQQLAKALNGTIEVTSYEGIGSQFSLSLNDCINENSKLISNSNQIPLYSAIDNDLEITNNLTGKVLLAEDNETNQQLISYFISKMGADVTVVNNGKSAVNRALDGDFDLIFMDMQMPIMSGMVATRKLRKKGFLKPIVALTANATKQDREQCISAGCNEFVSKPIDQRQLYSVTASYLKAQQPHFDHQNPSSRLQKKPMFAALINQFAQHLPEHITNIRQFAQTHQWTKVKQITHILKGTGGSLGFPLITDLATQVENQIAAADFSKANMLIDQLKLAADDVILSQTRPKAKIIYLSSHKKS